MNVSNTSWTEISLVCSCRCRFTFIHIRIWVSKTWLICHAGIFKDVIVLGKKWEMCFCYGCVLHGSENLCRKDANAGNLHHVKPYHLQMFVKGIKYSGWIDLMLIFLMLWCWCPAEGPCFPIMSVFLAPGWLRTVCVCVCAPSIELCEEV